MAVGYATMSDIRIRRAHMLDVKAIHGLLMACAKQGLLLPRALSHLYRHVRDFYVAEQEGGRMVACCALAPTWENLAEVCSLVVADDLRRNGLGRRIVQQCINDCRELRISKVFALTYQEQFFTRLGFTVVDKNVLPQKIWADCVHCPKYPDCDEYAVVMDVPEP